MTNLLYKATIITTPTAYGEGVLNSIKPAFSYGDELVTNGDMELDSGWSGVGITGGDVNERSSVRKNSGTYSRHADVDAIDKGFVSLTFPVTINTYYKVIAWIYVVSGQGRLQSGSGRLPVDVTESTTGIWIKHSFIDKASTTGDDTLLFRSQGGAAEFYIDDVSVKEVITADFDFTRSSTATRINPDYLIETSAIDTPRLDYHNGTASILLEPQSTNLILRSEEFDNSYWTKSGASITSDATTSPDGSLNADKLVEDTSTGSHVVYIPPQTNILANTDFTISAYVKSDGRKYIAIGVSHNSTTGTLAQFNTETKSLVYSGESGSLFTYTNSSIVEMTNDWFRISLTGQITLTSIQNIGVAMSDDIFTSYSLLNSANDYTGDGTSGIFIYGAQLEQLSYATSYIPTSGTTQTRSAETLNNAGNSDLINSEEGVLYVEIATLEDELEFRLISLSSGANINRVFIGHNSTTQQIQGTIIAGGSTRASLTHTVTDIKDFHKVAFKWKVNDFALWIDGVEVGTDDYGASFTLGVLDRLNFNGATGTQNDEFYGKCKTVAVFNEALTDTELACLTGTNDKEIFLNYYYRMQYVGANTEALGCAEQTFNI